MTLVTIYPYPLLISYLYYILLYHYHYLIVTYMLPMISPYQI